MGLNQEYNVSGDLWIGPDSAKSNVDANSGRVYMASDTQVDYYADNGSWVKMGVGSSSESVPSVTTEVLDNAHLASAYDGSNGGEQIQNAIDAADAEAGQNAVAVIGAGPDDVSGSSGTLSRGDLAQNAWEVTSPISLPDDTTLYLYDCYLFLGDGTDNNLIRNEEATDSLGGSGNSNENISVIGDSNAILDGNAGNQTTFNRETGNSHLNLGVRFLRADTLTIKGLSLRNTNGWAIKPELCDGVSIGDIRLDQNGNTANQDGVHPSACTDVTIENVRGTTGDDIVAVNANDTDNFTEVGGNCRNVNITDVTGNPQGKRAVRVYANNGTSTKYVIENINVENVTAHTNAAHVVNTSLSANGSGDNMRNITFSNINGRGSMDGVKIDSDTKEITISNVTVQSGRALVIDARADNLTATGLVSRGSKVVYINNTLYQSTISDISSTFADTAVHVANGTLRGTTISNIVSYTDNSGATLIDIDSGDGGNKSFVIRNVVAREVETLIDVASGVSCEIRDVTAESGVNTVYGNMGDADFEGKVPPIASGTFDISGGSGTGVKTTEETGVITDQTRELRVEQRVTTGPSDNYATRSEDPDDEYDNSNSRRDVTIRENLVTDPGSGTITVSYDIMPGAA